MVDSRVLQGRFVPLALRIRELESCKGQLSPAARFNLDRVAEPAAVFEQVLGHPVDNLFLDGDLPLETGVSEGARLGVANS
ncbi:MAG: hypothetical protein E3J64_01665 [Anaerolineales bacterium]|nr:MAG: hypothetical protein E3J64_01665 [Anaerolineales bacterium]